MKEQLSKTVARVATLIAAKQSFHTDGLEQQLLSDADVFVALYTSIEPMLSSPLREDSRNALFIRTAVTRLFDLLASLQPTQQYEEIQVGTWYVNREGKVTYDSRFTDACFTATQYAALSANRE